MATSNSTGKSRRRNSFHSKITQLWIIRQDETSNSTGKSRRRISFHSKITQLIVNYKTRWQRQIRLENQDDETRFIPRLLSWSWIIRQDDNVKFDWKIKTTKLVSFQDYSVDRELWDKMATSNSTGKSRRRNSFHSKITQLIVNYKKRWQRQICLENQDDETRFIPRLLSWSWIIRQDGNVKFDWKIKTTKLVSFQDYSVDREL